MHASTFAVLLRLAALSLVGAQASTDIVVTIGTQTTTAVLPAWPTSNSVALGPGPIVTASSLAAGVSSSAAGVISSAAGVISSAAGVISSAAGVISSATATSSVTLTLTESVTLTSTLTTVTTSAGTPPPVVVNATSTTTGPPTVVTAAADHLGFDGSMMGLVMFCILGLLML